MRCNSPKIPSLRRKLLLFLFTYAGGGSRLHLNLNLSRVLGLSSATCLLVLLGLAVFLPRLAVPPAYSAITPVSCNGPHPVSSCLDLAIDSSTLNIDIPTPTANGSFAYGSSTVNVRTNAPGYDLSLSGSTTNPNPTTNPSLINTSPSASGAVIAPTDGNFEYIFTDLTNSTWGFTTLAIPTSSLSATMSIWSAVPAATEPVVIKGSDNTNDSTGEDTTIRYGVNIDNNQASGTYTTQVRYSATADAFPAPTIASINPNSGSTAGGNTITITGTNFYDTTSVYIGTDECTSFTVNSPTEITCIVPANLTPGGYEVMVYANGGTAMRTSGYTYAAPIVTITAPTANQIFSAGTTSTTLAVTTNINAICYFSSSANFATSTQMATTNGTTHSRTITGLVNNSTITRYFRCQAASGHSYGNSASVTFYVKAAVPTVTITAPTANQIFSAGTANVTLTVATNIATTCYYSTTGSVTPTTTMSTTGGTAHSHNNPMSNNSSHTRYVRCRAGSGNTVSDYSSTVSSGAFYVRAAQPVAPTAFRPSNGRIIGADVNQVNNIGATVASGVNCTYTTNRGSISGDNITGLSAGATTVSYSCTAGSGNTASVARTGSWNFTIAASIGDGVWMQNVPSTTACPTLNPVRVVDHRDNSTYYVRRYDIWANSNSGEGNGTTIIDAAFLPIISQCWMHTNLAYAGGGVNDYGDVRTINYANGQSYNVSAPRYYVPTGANNTYWPNYPSGSLNGAGQYGYLYNWCAAMGSQVGSSACSDTATFTANTNVSICPANWHLPVYSATSSTDEFSILSGRLQNSSWQFVAYWAGMYSGVHGFDFIDQGAYGAYWTNGEYAVDGAMTFRLNTNSVGLSGFYKRDAAAVRCLLQLNY